MTSLRVAAIAREKDCSGREKELLDALDIDAVGLRVTECEQLRSLVMEFSNFFALNGSELGRTTITAHKIDTGETVHPSNNHHAGYHSPCEEKWIH